MEFEVFHGTLSGMIGTFRPGTHFGTREAAEYRVRELMEAPDSSRDYGVPKTADQKPTVIHAELRADNPFDMEDPGEWWPESYAEAIRAAGIPLSAETVAKWDDGESNPEQYLQSLGFDCIRYSNGCEDMGSVSWIAFSNSQITVLDVIDFHPAELPAPRGP